MVRRPFFFVAFLAVPLGSATFGIACASESNTGGVTPEVEGGATGDATKKDTSTPIESDAGADATTKTTCEITREYIATCGGDLTCGASKFDTWCAQNDKVINSEAYRRAEALCLTKANCDPDLRRDCEYKSYATATATAAQKAVVAAYCQTCEPADPTGCATRKTTYVPAAGIKSVDDVFVAGWELADPIADEIRTKCTGSALDAGGGDAAACLKVFANCAGGVYVDRLPDCPP
ncbi:MAG: hypothetical protein JST00_43340 [Deltaproteobacteria bacterium]|nr:hypothetical protein [Deltaproteobacteria bacterium]